jgi:hypothetical protein
MDDILYILIGIGWVAFGLYKNYQKQVKAQKNKVLIPKVEKQETSVKDIFEQLFPFEELTTNESESQEKIFEEFESLEEIEVSKKQDVIDTKQVELKKESKEIIAEKQNIVADFDLRKAVIYNVILERRYT